MKDTARSDKALAIKTGMLVAWPILGKVSHHRIPTRFATEEP